MEKTYKLLEHTEPLTYEEIKKMYKGYWVYIVNAQFDEEMRFYGGRPVVIGQTPFDGVEDGIYEQFDGDEYAPRCDLAHLRKNKDLELLLASLEGR